MVVDLTDILPNPGYKMNFKTIWVLMIFSRKHEWVILPDRCRFWSTLQGTLFYFIAVDGENPSSRVRCGKIKTLKVCSWLMHRCIHLRGSKGEAVQSTDMTSISLINQSLLAGRTVSSHVRQHQPASNFSVVLFSSRSWFKVCLGCCWAIGYLIAYCCVMQEADTDENQGTLGFDEFCAFYKMMSTRRDLYLLMLTYSNHKDYLDADDLRRFLETEQKVGSSQEKISHLQAYLFAMGRCVAF